MAPTLANTGTYLLPTPLEEYSFCIIKNNLLAWKQSFLAFPYKKSSYCIKKLPIK